MGTKKPQYDRLFDLLKQYAERYYVQTQQIYSKFGREWNPYPCRFEIDTYFLFQLSVSMQGLEYNESALQETCMDFEDHIIQSFSGKFPVADNLQNIIRTRITDYCERRNYALRENESHNVALLESLLQNIDADNVAEQVEAASPIVIGDFFEKSEIKASMLPVQMHISGEFRCCLKHLFRSDISSLSIQEMNKLIDNGREEAKEILSKFDMQGVTETTNVLKQLRAILTKQKKKWWQFWK